MDFTPRFTDRIEAQMIVRKLRYGTFKLIFSTRTLEGNIVYQRSVLHFATQNNI